MSETASIALVNGDVWSMDKLGSRHSAVLVVDGVIAVAGRDQDVVELATSRGIRVIDVDGKTVLPGFVDAHTHLELTCCSNEYWMHAHTPPHADLKAVRESIRKQIALAPTRGWLVARSSFDMHTKVSEQRLLSRAELDELSPGRPLAVAAGLHVMSLNTAAMQSLGILESSSTDQMTIHRDENGNATGVVTEVWDLLPPFSKAEVKLALRKHVAQTATCHGVTTVASISYERCDAEAAAELIAEGMPLHLRSYWHDPRVGSLREAVRLGYRSAQSVPTAGFGGMKVFVDGQHGDGMDNVFDDFKWAQDDLDEFVIEATENQIQVLMHAVSPGAVRRAVRAIERSNGAKDNPMRHRIEHGGDYLATADLERIRASGAILVTTPQFISSTQGERSEEGAPLRAILDAGVPLVAGTDTTGTVPEGAAPLFNIACAIHRGGPGEHTDRSEAITFEEGVRLFTVDAAFAIFEEHSRGRISEGLAGDLVVLDRCVDDLRSSEEYFDLSVIWTIFAGRIVHENQS